MNPLDHIIRLYADFETRVQRTTIHLPGSDCAACSSVCCKVESRLREAYPPSATYSDKTGWLSATGCVLKTARPPVCYEYLCGEILSAQPTSVHRYAVNVLSQLITHIGKRAYRGKHIVEICEDGELQRIKLPVFKRRLAESEAAFHAIETFYENTFLSAEDWGKLTKIVSAPKGVKLPE
jgi:hypothetical protein